MRKRNGWLVCLLVLTVLVTAGCQSKAKPTVGPQKGMEAPVFKGTTIDGSDFELQDAKGDKLVLVFWQSISKPAQRELVTLQKLDGQLENLQVLTVNLGEEKAVVEEFVGANKLELPTLIDNKKLADLYRVDYLPTTVFVDEEGIITSVHHEELSMEQIIDAVNKNTK